MPAKKAAPAIPDSPAKPARLPIILAAAGLLMGLAGAGGALYAWKVASARPEAAEEKGADAKAASRADEKDKDKEKDKKARKASVFLPPETFTVNLQKDAGRDRFLQVGIVLEVADSPAADAVKAQMPVIRSGVLLLLASRGAEELATPEGKDKLAAQVLERVRKPVEGAAEIAGVERVHYAAFIIQ